MSQELGRFLREKRRSLGLRREQVSERAGIGYDWCVRIEQGRGQASVDVVRRLAHALELDRAETDYVFALAHGRGTVVPTAPEDLPPAVLRVMHAQEPSPAYVLTTGMDLLAWNSAACAFYDVDWGKVPDDERNLLFLMMTEDRLRERIVGWEDHARLLVHRCRALWAGRAEEPGIAALLERLSADSAEFRRWWDTPVPEALDMDPIHKSVVDREFGTLTVEQTAWLFGARSDHVLILSIPLDDGTGPTSVALRGLEARWARR